VPPRCGRSDGFEVERVSWIDGIDRVAELTPADLVARVGATPRWSWGYDRPSQDQACGRLGEVYS